MASDKALAPARSAGRFGRLIRSARSRGPGYVFYRLARRVAEARYLRNCFKFCLVEIFSVPVSQLKCSRRIPRAFVVRKAEERDLPALGAYFSDPQRVRRRFERRDICVITLAGDEICAAVWLAIGPKDYREDWNDLGCVFHFPAGVGWSYDGKGTRWGAWGALMGRLPEYLKELEIAEVYTLIDCGNRASQESHKSLGYRPLGTIGCVGLLGLALRIYRVSGESWQRLPQQAGKLVFSTRQNATSP